jgi:hypothetical protein
VLDAEAKRRHARHLLLVEIGEAGQERLCQASFRIAAGADPRAALVAEEYLVRSGMQAAPVASPHAVTLAGADAVARLAGDAVLQEAAAALLGAYGAVETIKRCVGAGSAGQLPGGLRLTRGLTS